MPSRSDAIPPVLRMPVAALLGWLVPGGGHFFIGERARGTIFLVAITLAFWGGIAIGGVTNTVNPKERSLWFMGQVCAGVNPMIAMLWGQHSGAPPKDREGGDPRWYAYGHTEDTAVVYTAIAGMLNLLAIFDVLARLEKSSGQESHVASARVPRRAGP